MNVIIKLPLLSPSIFNVFEKFRSLPYIRENKILFQTKNPLGGRWGKLLSTKSQS